MLTLYLLISVWMTLVDNKPGMIPLLETLSLMKETWQRTMITQSLSSAWQMRDLQGGNWLPATVPGGTYTDLLAAGKIPDPFFGENEKQTQWVADHDWEYCQEFIVQPELLEEDKVELVCTGLDTLAEITLNGHPLGQA